MDEWQAIVDKHGEAVWRTAWRLLGREADAADCYQETFLAALELAGRERVRNWGGLLTRLATWRALDRLRRRAREGRARELPADCPDRASPGDDPPGRAQAAELSGRLREALGQLPQQQAQVFCLRCVEELSYRDIAGQLELSLSQVGVLLHRARGRLREILGEAEDREMRS